LYDLAGAEANMKIQAYLTAAARRRGAGDLCSRCIGAVGRHAFTAGEDLVRIFSTRVVVFLIGRSAPDGIAVGRNNWYLGAAITFACAIGPQDSLLASLRWEGTALTGRST
jgi:hypothetical protein